MKRIETLIEVRRLKKYFSLPPKIFSRTTDFIKAVDGVDFTLRRGETLGVVGESGCGKTTLGRSILRMADPISGSVLFKGENIAKYKRKKLKNFRREMQIIFQDPFSSLNPRQRVGSIIGEPFVIHTNWKNKKIYDSVIELMELVGLHSESYFKYPHQFSGGQRQRIGIARALAVKPEFIVCDEPVSALDVSIQGQIINLLLELQQKFSLSYLLISHDLSVVKHVSDRVAVMYLGRFVELAPNKELYDSPCHPYTRALLSACPIPDPGVKRARIFLKGDVPSALNPPVGCHFITRCPEALSSCRLDIPPPWEEIREGHWVRCWRMKDFSSV